MCRSPLQYIYHTDLHGELAGRFLAIDCKKVKRLYRFVYIRAALEIDMRILSGAVRDKTGTIRVEGGLPDSEGVRLSGLVDAEWNVERSPSEILLDGEIRGKQWLTCSRSLEEFEDSFVVPLRVRIVLDPSCRASELVDDGDEEYLLRINPTTTVVDLSECVRQQILLHKPLSPIKNPEADFFWSSEGSEEPVKQVDPRWGALEKLRKRMESPSRAEEEQESQNGRS